MNKINHIITSVQRKSPTQGPALRDSLLWFRLMLVSLRDNFQPMGQYALLLILISGLLNPIQTGVNSTLRGRLRTPILSSTVSFIIGLTCLSILTLATCGRLFPEMEVQGQLPWWAWGGGVMGAIGLTGNILLFPKLGGVLTVLFPMLGQIAMSVMIDSFGWFGTSAIPLDAGRITGLCLVIGGLLLYMVDKNGQNGKMGRSALLWSLGGIMSGFTFAIQPVMNGKLAVAFSSPIQSAFISFLTSTAILVTLVLLIPSERHNIPLVRKTGGPWWLWTGGLIGAGYVASFALVTPMTGVGMVTLVGILGMTAGGVIVDSRGMFGRDARKIRPLQYLGLVLLLSGVVLIKATEISG